MYRDNIIALAIPAYNEEKLIYKTVETVPAYVDRIYVVNDASRDGTGKRLEELAAKHSRLTVITNPKNRGIGYSVTTGFKQAVKDGADIAGIIAGDAQCDPAYMQGMIDCLLDENVDYVKANRFLHAHALQQMPVYRRIGNIFITLLTKFATGYYSIFDTQNGYGMFRRSLLLKIPWELIGERYDYENTLLIALSILGAKVKDVAVPAIYGDETSTIKFWPVAMRALRVVSAGFWKRIYYSYVIYNFHPIALFLFSGLMLLLLGILIGVWIVVIRFMWGLTPSTGTVMLCVLPVLTGFQLVLTALMLDINRENKPI